MKVIDLTEDDNYWIHSIVERDTDTLVRLVGHRERFWCYLTSSTDDYIYCRVGNKLENIGHPIKYNDYIKLIKPVVIDYGFESD